MNSRRMFCNKWIQNISSYCQQVPNQRVAITSLVPPNLHETVDGKKQAAVLVPLCNVHGQASVLFTVRTHTVSTHKGQVSFPGGHIDPGETVTEAALRETIEELGSGIGSIRILGIGQTVIAITGTLVTPVLAFVENDLGDLQELQPSPKEVSEVFTRPVDHLLQADQKLYEEYSRLGKTYKMPVFCPNDSNRIWGLTAMILDGVMNHAIVPNRPTA